MAEVTANPVQEWDSGAANTGDDWPTMGTHENENSEADWQKESDGRNNISKHEDGIEEIRESLAQAGINGGGEDGPRPMGPCFNCGETGHNKAECPNPRVFTGTCRICSKEGHPAAECPDKPPALCHNCKQEGHRTLECKNNRALELSHVVDISPDEAWGKLQSSDKERDLDAFREALFMYSKAVPESTFSELETGFRNQEFSVHLIAIEKEIPKTQTIVNLQGKIDCQYQAQFHFSPRPRRKTASAGWPESAEVNMERLANAGFVQDRKVPCCDICGELGHIAKYCKEERVEHERTVVKCFNCGEEGHRVRDCTKDRVDPSACRNCKKSGHQATECPEPRSAEGVECKRCNEVGHFAKDCPNSKSEGCRNCGQEGHMARDCEQPRNPATVTCRNCDQMGHFSRDCPQPKDWSRVKCSNCGEMGHTIKRCKQPLQEAETEEEPSDPAPEAAFDAGAGGAAW